MTKPNYPPVKPENIPPEVQALPWGLWKAEQDKNGKATKPPCNAQGYKISTNKPEQWSAFEKVATAYQGGGFDGFGVLIQRDSDIRAIDLDVLKELIPAMPEVGKLLKQAREQGIYCEKSPSGTGLRLFVRAPWTLSKAKTNLRPPGDWPEGEKTPGIELFGQGFVTVTGVPAWKDTALGTVQDAQWLLDGLLDLEKPDAGGKASQTRQEAPQGFDLEAMVDQIAKASERKQPALWAGDWQGASGDLGAGVGEYPGQSEADFALACEVARQAYKVGVPGGQLAEIIEQVFSRCGLAERDKWADRADYRERTVQGAIDATKSEASEDSPWPNPLPVEFSLPPVHPFTPDMLPSALAAYVADCSERMSCPPDFIAAPLVVALSAAVGNRVRVAPKAHDLGFQKTPNLWGLIVGNSGLKKSPAVNAGVNPLNVLEDELTEKNARARQQYELDKLRHAAEVKAFGNRAKVDNSLTADDVPVAPPEPRDERLIVNDATTEKLGEILLGSPHGVLLNHDELMGYVEKMNAQGKEGDRAFALTGWNGDQGYKWDRIGRGSTHVPNVTLSVFGGTQPGKLNAHVRAATRGGGGADGFLQRFQIAVYPDTATFKIVDRPPNFQLQQKVFDLFKRAWKIDPAAIGAQPDLEGKKYRLHFDSEAQRVFNQWWERFENKIRSGDKHPALESHYSKFVSMVPSLALLFHLAEGNTGPINKEPLMMALKWASYLASHAKRIYAGAVASAEIAAQSLARHIQKRDLGAEFGLRDVYRHGWAGLANKEEAQPAVDILIDQLWLREVRPETGRRIVRYKVNPKVFPA